MFYSHEILTSRKHGVATVWLVATLGEKSTTKKVTRKAILNVNVQKACETIMEPEAPLALRLQGNLLYGVSRVYSQQVGYVLADTQTAQNTIRALMKISSSNGLDPGAGKAHPNQLILMDDPAFVPEMELLPFNFDPSLLERDIIAAGSSQQSLMSPGGGYVSSASASQRSATLPGISLPSSSSFGAGFQLLHPEDPFAEPSTPKNLGITGRLFQNEEQNMFDELNLDFVIGDDGIMHDVTEEELQARRVADPLILGRMGSDSAASAHVRRDHQDAIARLNNPLIDADGDFMMQYDDDQILPYASPFPVMSGANPSAPPGRHRPSATLSPLIPSSESGAEASQRARKPRGAKLMPVDQQLEYRNADLRSWQNGYLDNMAKAIKDRELNQKRKSAKKTAYQYVWGSGLGGVGNGVGFARLQGPLAGMFSGDALLEGLTGKVIGLKVSAERGAKRPFDEVTSGSETRRVRARQEEELGRGINMSFNDADGGMLGGNEDSSGIEIGRDAPSALEDHPPSSAMPWNMSASLHSHQRGQSSSIAGRGSQVAGSLGAGGRRSTIRSSPLIGRGSNIPGELENFNLLQDESLPVQFGRSFEVDGTNQSSDAVLRKYSPPPAQGSQEQEFELFGTAAGVDTQTAASSQWMRSALDNESNNFFEYVRNSILEKSDHLAVDEDEDELQATGEEAYYVSFEELFHPTQNSRVVAAQAFYHVLNLATRRRVWVQQLETAEGELEGEIRIGVVGVLA
ncbi:hypothetical protein BP6252_04814 [Coleophoma cylindrospora]|uniref:Rad21/Rec8-like protein N-terminal domain-containing protein n=1 Tax=Coleophoma cylindrospora TaxID=1849047 RepID=A0A3D8S1P9_9HELO|nr:hypothetical protein BP6252_04814 [Coleophoma cylindrospora]